MMLSKKCTTILFEKNKKIFINFRNPVFHYNLFLKQQSKEFTLMWPLVGQPPDFLNIVQDIILLLHQTLTMVTRGSVNVCASPERSSLDYMLSPDMPLQSFTSTKTNCSASQLPITFEPVDSVSNLILSTPTPGCSCSLASFVSAIGLSRVPTRGVQTC